MNAQNITGEEAKLLRMAEEIHQFFRHQGDAAPVAAASHLKQFWAPTMRTDFLAAITVQGDQAGAPLQAIAMALQEEL